MASLWQQLLGGYLSPLNLPKTPAATFIQPLTPPQSKVGTAAFGQAQGGRGNTPSVPKYGLGSAPPPIPGIGTPTFGKPQQTMPKYNQGLQFSGAQPAAYGHERGGFGRQTSISTQVGTQVGTQTQGGAGTQYGTAYGTISASAGQGNEYSYINRAISRDGTPIVATNPFTGQQINPLQTLTNYQIEQEALAAGTDIETYASTMGYTKFGGTYVYNPVGGAGGQSQSSLPWWQQGQAWAGGQSFSSEKAANKAYAEYKEKQKEANKKYNPRRPNQNNDKKKEGGGTELATSIMGTG